MDNNAWLLPPTADSTGTHSLYTSFRDYEIMFHVSTLLPYTPNNKQQVKAETQAGGARVSKENMPLSGLICLR